MECSQNILQTAKDCGFDNCGIIAVDALNGFDSFLAKRIRNVPSSAGFYGNMKTFTPISQRYPWAKTIIICTYEYGKYRYPVSMQGKYGKSFFLAPESGYPDGFDSNEFENLMFEKGIRLDGKNSFPLRYAAMAAGLGIIRKNNFFYTEKGSYVGLVGYVSDCEETLIHHLQLNPCSDKCELCQQACKTKALCAPFTLDPTRCISFWTTFGKGNIPDGLNEEMFEEWICGCDNCQDVCPYNQKQDWNSGDPFGDLENVAPMIEPKILLEQSDEFLINRVIPKTDNHLTLSDCEVLRTNAARAMRYQKKQQ